MAPLQQKREVGDYMVCVAYIVGVADVLANQYPDYICLPPNATQGQLADVVAKYLRDHPELRHYVANTEVGNALADAFPCIKRP